jgi:hypothetical protein
MLAGAVVAIAVLLPVILQPAVPERQLLALRRITGDECLLH